jgi:hypothetical protein
MTRRTIIFLAILATGLSAAAGSGESGKEVGLRLLLSEVQPGALASQHYCILVFDDHHYHAEKANHKLGKDRDRIVYEGKLSEADWTALVGILESKELRELEVPPRMVPLAIQNTHPYTISVARPNGFQNMEFLTKESLKPYESQVKPLLQWWKASRGKMAVSAMPPDSRCSLDSTDAIISN